MEMGVQRLNRMGEVENNYSCRPGNAPFCRSFQQGDNSMIERIENISHFENGFV